MENTMELYNRGKEIKELIEKNTEISLNAEGEEKIKADEKLQVLNKANTDLKELIYKQAKSKSGIDYSKEDQNPELLRKKYNEQLADLKKRKHGIKLEKIRLTKLEQTKRTQIDEQFAIACEKYKNMLDAGKITNELYESRINNMKEARMLNKLDLHDAVVNIDDEYDKVSNEISDIENKLNDLEQKEILFNEYGEVYYRLFGEVLADRNKAEQKIDDKQNVKNEKTTDDNREPDDKEITQDENKEKKAKDTKGSSSAIKETSGENADVSSSNSEPEEPKENELEKNKEEEPVIITSKSMFNELYKKLKKETITEKELNALVETLEKPENYDKYGITTGIVFNKAKKILKYQGARNAKKIEKFLRNNSVFKGAIKFDSSIEKDGFLSHDMLNSWKDIDEKLVYTGAKFSVEEYIDKMQRYKENGNELTKEQEDMLKQALDIKKNIGSYRKALNVNYDVTKERKSKETNSIFYRAFSNKFKEDSRRALPETRDTRETEEYIVMPRLDLKGLTNTEPTSEELKSVPVTADIHKDEKSR